MNQYDEIDQKAYKLAYKILRPYNAKMADVDQAKSQLIKLLHERESQLLKRVRESLPEKKERPLKNYATREYGETSINYRQAYRDLAKEVDQMDKALKELEGAE
jgi:hypothetical protein